MDPSHSRPRQDLLAIVQAAIAAADPAVLVDCALESSGPGRIGPVRAGTGGLVVIAAGKAARAMARPVARRLGPQIRAGLIVAPGRPAGEREATEGEDRPEAFSRFAWFAAGHPLPTTDSELAGRRALSLADAVGAEETLLVLLSGGASALMAVPARGLTIVDKRGATERLLGEGAGIDAVNTVRKHASAIKGGWLAARTKGQCVTYAISDVVGDDPSVIGSGPTVADPTTYDDARRLLARWGGREAYPRALVRHFDAGVAGQVAETPKPGDPRLTRATIAVVGSGRDAVDGAAREARRRGYHIVSLEQPIVGEAREAARAHVSRVARLAARSGRPLCVVSGGETTVRVVGHGRGGRNQEFVLAAVPLLARPDAGLRAPTDAGAGAPASILLASVGTDGIDGPTDAAGALADDTTLARARAAGLPGPEHVLDDNDAYRFFAGLGDLIRTGPTGTNVGDVQVVLIE